MSTVRKIAWGLIVMLALGAGGYWFLAVPAVPEPNGADSRARFQTGPYPVVNERFTAVDHARPTQAYNDFPGLPERILEGELWRPAGAQRPGPLLIYSHGFMSFRQEGLYLYRFLASHGYTVVAVDYPLSGYHAPDGPLAADVVNQPGDISFLIDRMLARNEDPADSLYRTIDPRQIAVAGVSLGGLTSILAAFHPQWHDPRIAAAISIAGPTSLFTPGFFRDASMPFLMIYAGADAIVPYASNATPVLAARPGTILVTLADASHAAFAQPASTLMRFVDNPDGIGCRVVTQYLGRELLAENLDLQDLLGGTAQGVAADSEIAFCTEPPIPVAMAAARQHMFTTLAAFAFLQSVFAAEADTRAAAHDYLVHGLARDNPEEVSVAL